MRASSRLLRFALILHVAAALAGAAVIEGVVIETRSGRPLARVRVSLRSISGAAAVVSNRTYTDASGRFVFSGLPAGAFFVSAEKPNYASASFGQKKWNGKGSPIVLDAGARFVAELHLSRLGVLTGQIRDENGVGIENHPVLVYREGRPPKLAQRGSTDDRGVFRIPGLEPGGYHARTGPRRMDDGSGMLPTYFGHGTVLSESKTVEVRLDEETPDVDIMPRTGRLYKLTGRAAWAGISTVSLYSDLGRMTSGVGGDGRFSFDQLPPGSYELLAESEGDGPRMAAYRAIFISDDIEGLILEPARVPRLSLLCDLRDSKLAVERQVSVFARRVQPPDGQSPRRFLCQEEPYIGPGTWEIGVATPPSVYVTGMSLDGKPLETNRFVLAPGGNPPLDILLSAKPATLLGVVKAPGGVPSVGATIFLKPVDPDVRVRLFERESFRTDTNGQFRVDGLPPGTYQVVASFEYEKSEEVDWGLSQVRTVRLDEGKESSVELELVGSM